MVYTHIAALILGLAAGFAGAWNVQAWRADSAELKRTQAAKTEFLKREKEAYAPSVAHERFKEKERVVYEVITETVDKIIERPVYRQFCADDDGVRLINRAVNGSADDPRESGPAVPVAD
jgi:hypothetical protein